MYKVNYENAIDLDIVPESSAADIIKDWMAYYHLTQSDFAKHVAISQKQLSFILNRKAYMSMQVARQIEEATGIKAQLLLRMDLNYQEAHLPESSANDKQVIPYPWVHEG